MRVSETDLSAPPTHGRWPRHAWALVLVGGAAALLGIQASSSPLVRDALYLLLSGGLVVALLTGVAWHQPRHRRPWLVMAAGQSLWFLADAVYYWLADVRHVDAYPSGADALYLAGYPVLAVSIFALIRSRGRERDLAGLLDGAIVTAGLSVVLWVVLVEPTLALGVAPTASTAVSLAYPLADIALIGVLIRLLVSVGAGSASLRLLLLALGLLISADCLNAALDVYGLDLGPLADLVWPASYVAWSAAALHPSMARVCEPTQGNGVRLRRLRVLAMALATLVTPGILAVEEATGSVRSAWTVVVGSMVIFLLVVARMNVAIVAIAAVSRQRNRLQEELGFQATHDSLTHLPNRAQTMRLVSEAVEEALGSGGRAAVLFIDLDGFKTVNDTLGHGPATRCCAPSPHGCRGASGAATWPPGWAATSSWCCCGRG